LPLKYPADGFLFATNARIIFFLFFPFFIWFSGFNCLVLANIFYNYSKLVSINSCLFSKGHTLLKAAFMYKQVLFFLKNRGVVFAAKKQHMQVWFLFQKSIYVRCGFCSKKQHSNLIK